MSETQITNEQIKNVAPLIGNERLTLVYLDGAGEEHEQPLEDLSQSGTLVDPESGEDMALIGARVITVAELERRLWAKVAINLGGAKAMHFDGCHKIYLSMDDNQVKEMQANGYKSHEPDMDLLRESFENSCSLRFITAVHTVKGHASKGYIELIPQSITTYGEDLEEGTPAQIVINLSEGQRNVLDGLRSPHVEAISKDEDQMILAYEVIDDNQVTLYSIAPDGSYTYESLEGFHQGWHEYTSEGEPIGDQDDDEVDDQD